MSLKIVIYLVFIQQCMGIDLPREPCRSELKINNDHYNLSESYNVGDTCPTDVHFDVYGNIFFVETGQNDNGYYFNVNMIKFKTITPQRIPGLPEGISYSIAIDKLNTKVYFGTGKGIYIYNYETHNATSVSSSAFKLDMIFVDKDGNKYVTDNEDGINELYLLDGEKKIPFHTLESLNEMSIDDKNNFYFIKEKELYVLKSSQSVPVFIGNVSYDGMAQISFHDNTIFIASDSLAYFHENDTGSLKYIKNTPGNITAIAFDKGGNFVLGMQGHIIEYKKTECNYLRDNHVIDEYLNQ